MAFLSEKKKRQTNLKNSCSGIRHILIVTISSKTNQKNRNKIQVDSYFVVIIKWNNFCGSFSFFRFSFRFICRGEIYYFKIKTFHWNMVFHRWFIISFTVYSHIPVFRLYVFVFHSLHFQFYFKMQSNIWLSDYRMEREWENPSDKIPKFAFTNTFNDCINLTESIIKMNDSKMIDLNLVHTLCTVHNPTMYKNEEWMRCWMLNRKKWVFDLLFNFQFEKFVFGSYQERMNVQAKYYHRYLDSIQFNCYIQQSTYILPIHVRQMNNERSTMNNLQYRYGLEWTIIMYCCLFLNIGMQ